MIAHLTRVMILFQLLGMVFIALVLQALAVADHWASALMIAGAVVLLARGSIIVNNFFLSHALAQRRADGRRLTLPATARLLLQELWCSLRCWFWLFPFARPYVHPATDDTGCPVLLLHGYGANSGFWVSLHQRLTDADIRHGAPDLEPVLGSIDSYAPLIEDAAQQLTGTASSAKLILVCHSMGGLAARAWIRRYGHHRVARVITLGTPHAGSLLAGYGIGINARQMLPVSAWNREEQHWLSALAASEESSEETTQAGSVRSLFVSLWSRHDNIVAPQASAVLPGATTIAVEGVGHVALGFDARVLDAVMAEISAVRRSRSSAGSE